MMKFDDPFSPVVSVLLSHLFPIDLACACSFDICLIVSLKVTRLVREDIIGFTDCPLGLEHILVPSGSKQL